MDPAPLQQVVMENNETISEAAAYEPPTYSYDEVFPALPDMADSFPTFATSLGQRNMKNRVASSLVTQVFHVPYEERKLDHFGENEERRICQEIMKDSGAHIEISLSKDQSLTFLVTGKQDDVLRARKDILTRFQTQATLILSIPKEHHRFIFGKSGHKLQHLEKITATKIAIPRTFDHSNEITIIGPKEGIDRAAHEMTVISDEQSRQANECISIPHVFHPFITGAQNTKLNELMAETKAKINVPPLSVQKDEIRIHGEKEGVLKAKETILAIYEEMKRKCSTVSVEVKKSQHKYIIGRRGETIAGILGMTGVSVEMPPNDSISETITLRGPQDKLGNALTLVYEKANSVIIQDIEAPAWIHKYIIGPKGANIQEITQDLPKVHVEFTDKEDKIKIEGPPEEVEKAQKALEKKTKELVQRITFAEISVDPKYHKHVIGKKGANVNRIKKEYDVLISIPESSYNDIIRIEGNFTGVDAAKKDLLELVEKKENEREKDLIIEQKYHRQIIGPRGEGIQKIRNMFNQVQVNFTNPDEKRNVVTVRGNKEDVEKCSKHLMKIYKELVESSHKILVSVPKSLHKFIIGKDGANIRKIREETNTKIDLPTEGSGSDVIIIVGKKENGEDARDRIMKIQNDMIKIVQQDIIIPSKFHNSIIGAKGKQIQAIMKDCGNVTVRFPTIDSESDKVTIRGTKEEVDKAKKKLVDLSNEKQLSDYSVKVKAKPEHHKFLIGPSGSNIRKVRDETGARITFPSDQDEDRESITISGRKEEVSRAKEELEAQIRQLNDIVEDEMYVDSKHHRFFVARRGDVLRRISDEFGGVTISFPRPGVQGDQVVLKGSREGIQGAKKRILEIVEEREQMVTVECVIPQRLHRTVMGSRGCNVQDITRNYDVKIKFPDKEQDNQYDNLDEEQVNGETEDAAEPKKADIIYINGKKENCDKAKEELLKLVPITVDVNVPFAYHRFIIGQKGKDVRDMMKRYNVNIVVPPERDYSDLIKVSGSPANVEETKIGLMERCEELENERLDRIARGYQVELEVKPEYHPKIIGKKGAVISKIREDYNVQIQFPKKDDPEEHIITITGYKKDAEGARDAIMKIVNELNSMVTEELVIDHKVHSRLIGSKGRNIRQIMNNYKVDIVFPHSPEDDPDIVKISGTEDSLYDAKEHLLLLGEEYLQDLKDYEALEQYLQAPSKKLEEKKPREENKGFIVKGGPWENRDTAKSGIQVAPNTACSKEFPSFGESNPSPTPIVWPHHS